jgi:polysaccharide biosynthesis transport protein
MFEEEINLKDYLHIIRKRRWVIVTVLFVVAISVTILTFRQTPVYQATARILIEKETPNILTFKEVMDLDTSNQDYYQTQYKILKSRTLAKQVLEKLGLLSQAMQQAPAPEGFSLSGLWAHLQELLGLHEGQVLSDADKANDREQHIITKFLDQITVIPIRGSRLVDVSVDSIDRKQTALIANTLIDAYIEQNLAGKLSATKEAVSWLGKELATTQKKLADSEAALQTYKEQQEIISISLEDKQNIVMQKLSELNTAVNDARIKRAALEAEYKKIQQSGISEMEAIPKVINNPLIQQLKVELGTLETQLSELQKKFRDKHPDIVVVRSQIISVRKRIDAEINRITDSVANEYEGAHVQEQDLTKMLEQQKREALDLDQKSIKYKELQREVESNQRIYDTLLQRAKETSISERMETSNIDVVDRATIPMTPIAPQKKRNILLGFFAGLILGATLAFFFEYLDNSIKTADDIKQYLDIPFLGLIPKVSLKELPTQQTRQPADIIMALNPSSNASEAYRSLRTNVTFSLLNDHYLAIDRGAVLLVTSSGPSEGKSCVIANLGIAMAQSGIKTLIIDCDFRRPVMHKIFNLTNIEVGFADMITNVKAYGTKKGIKATEIPNLHVIPCGKIPSNPAELLGSTLARMIIGTLSEKYDKILIDSPPVNTVTDPVILSRIANGVIFIVRAGETKRDMAQRARDQLRAAEAVVLGGVLNNVDFEKDRYYYYSYHYQQYYNENSKSKSPKKVSLAPFLGGKNTNQENHYDSSSAA